MDWLWFLLATHSAVLMLIGLKTVCGFFVGIIYRIKDDEEDEDDEDDEDEDETIDTVKDDECLAITRVGSGDDMCVYAMTSTGCHKVHTDKHCRHLRGKTVHTIELCKHCCTRSLKNKLD